MTDNKFSAKISPNTIYDFDPRNLPPEYLQAIGLLIAASSQTEHTLKMFIGALLGIDQIQSAALSAHLSFPLKDNIIRALAELSAPSLKELDEIDDLLDSVSDAIDKRNTIAHNSFMIDPKTNQVYTHKFKARGSLTLELKPISVDEIKTDAIAVYEAGMDIMRFMTSRGLSEKARIKPLREAVDRKKKARKSRRIGNA